MQWLCGQIGLLEQASVGADRKSWTMPASEGAGECLLDTTDLPLIKCDGRRSTLTCASLMLKAGKKRGQNWERHHSHVLCRSVAPMSNRTLAPSPR